MQPNHKQPGTNPTVRPPPKHDRPKPFSIPSFSGQSRGRGRGGGQVRPIRPPGAQANRPHPFTNRTAVFNKPAEGEAGSSTFGGGQVQRPPLAFDTPQAATTCFGNGGSPAPQPQISVFNVSSPVSVFVTPASTPSNLTPNPEPTSFSPIPAQAKSTPPDTTLSNFMRKDQPSSAPVSSSSTPLASEDESRRKRFQDISDRTGNRFLEMKSQREGLRSKYISLRILPDPDKPTDLADAIKLTGTCQDMCPAFEREEREFQKELDRFEVFPGTTRVDPRIAVKIYRRPAAGRELPLPEDVRPPEVLRTTLDYLFHELLPASPQDERFTAVQPFLWNRTRAIRQDFIVQSESGPITIDCHERIARYHILCLHWKGGPGASGWSEQQELEQLRKTLRSLIEFYDDLRRGGQTSSNEAEFRAYNLLLHLRDPETLREVELLPTTLFRSTHVQTALLLHGMAQKSNNLEKRGQPRNTEATLNFFSHFFGAIRKTQVTYLMACLAENSFGSIRVGALKAIGKAYMAQHRALPIEFVVKCLGLDDEKQAIEMVGHLGVDVEWEEGKVTGIKVSKSTVLNEEKPLPVPFSGVVEGKRGSWTCQDVVDGRASGSAPPPPEVQSTVTATTLKVSPSFLQTRQALSPAAPAFVPLAPKPTVAPPSILSPITKPPSFFTQPAPPKPISKRPPTPPLPSVDLKAQAALDQKKRAAKPIATNLAFAQLFSQLINTSVSSISTSAIATEQARRRALGREELLHHLSLLFLSTLISTQSQTSSKMAAMESVATTLRERFSLKCALTRWRGALSRREDERYQSERLEYVRSELKRRGKSFSRHSLRRSTLASDDTELGKSFLNARKERSHLWSYGSFLSKVIERIEDVLLHFPPAGMGGFNTLYVTAGGHTVSKWLRRKFAVGTQLRLFDLVDFGIGEGVEEHVGLVVFECDPKGGKGDAERLKEVERSNAVRKSPFAVRLLVVQWGEGLVIPEEGVWDKTARWNLGDKNGVEAMLADTLRKLIPDISWSSRYHRATLSHVSAPLVEIWTQAATLIAQLVPQYLTAKAVSILIALANHAILTILDVSTTILEEEDEVLIPPFPSHSGDIYATALEHTEDEGTRLELLDAHAKGRAFPIQSFVQSMFENAMKQVEEVWIESEKRIDESRMRELVKLAVEEVANDARRGAKRAFEEATPPPQKRSRPVPPPPEEVKPKKLDDLRALIARTRQFLDSK